jgi:RNAse (barnase) inhibitor barstar
MTMVPGGMAGGMVPGGIYRLAGPVGVGSLVVGLVGAGVRVAALDGAAMGDREAVFDWFTRALDLPMWFGRNWDALVDVLGDLSWLGGRPVALVWRRFDAMPPALAATVSAVIDAAVERRAGAELPPLYVLLPPGVPPVSTAEPIPWPGSSWSVTPV